MTKEELEKSLNFVNEERERIQRELERKDNNWNELKEWLKYEIYCDFSNEMTKAYQDSLDKIRELENSGSDE